MEATYSIVMDDNSTGETTTEYVMYDDYEYFDYEPYERACAVISFVMFLLIVPLNIVLIYTLLVKNKKRKRSRLHFFILHLAAADILVGVITVLPDGIMSAMYSAWYGGDIFCRIWRFLKMASICASNNLLIGLSIDRFLAIKCPMKFVNIGSKIDKSLVVGAWCISIASSGLFLIYSEGRSGTVEEGGYCDLILPKHWWKPYITLVAIVVYILPTVVIAMCYIAICVIIWMKWKEGLQLSETNKIKDAKMTIRNTTKKPTNTGLLPKAKVKSIKMTLVICLAFFICWTPYFVCTLFDVYEMEVFNSGVSMVLGMLYPLNSAANPIVFILFNLKMFGFTKLAGNGTSANGSNTNTQVTTAC